MKKKKDKRWGEMYSSKISLEKTKRDKEKKDRRMGGWKEESKKQKTDE